MKPAAGQLPDIFHNKYRGCVLDVAFNEAQGGRVWDHYNRVAGTLTNFPASPWSIESDGPFLQFDGSNDWISVPHRDRHTFTHGMTLVMRIKLDSLSRDNALISKSTNSAGTDGWWISYKDSTGPHPSEIQFSMNDSDYFSGGSFIADTNWHWIHIVWDTSNVYFYRDGVQHSSASTSGSITNVNEPIRIGREYNAYVTNIYYDGGMSCCRMYNYPMTSAMVANDLCDSYEVYRDTTRNPVFKAGAVAAISPTSVLRGPLYGPMAGPV